MISVNKCFSFFHRQRRRRRRRHTHKKYYYNQHIYATIIIPWYGSPSLYLSVVLWMHSCTLNGPTHSRWIIVRLITGSGKHADIQPYLLYPYTHTHTICTGLRMMRYNMRNVFAIVTSTILDAFSLFFRPTLHHSYCCCRVFNLHFYIVVIFLILLMIFYVLKFLCFVSTESFKKPLTENWNLCHWSLVWTVWMLPTLDHKCHTIYNHQYDICKFLFCLQLVLHLYFVIVRQLTLLIKLTSSVLFIRKNVLHFFRRKCFSLCTWLLIEIRNLQWSVGASVWKSI